MLNAMVNFAETVLAVANNQVLLSESDGKCKNSGGEHEPCGRSDKYVRLLQAIGNAVIVQVDNLRKSSDFKDDLEEGKSIELAGLKNSESTGEGALKELKAEIEKDPNFPHRDYFSYAVSKGDEQVGDALTNIRTKLNEDAKSVDSATLMASSFNSVAELIAVALAEDISKFALKPNQERQDFIDQLKHLLLSRKFNSTNGADKQKYDVALNVWTDISADAAQVAIPDDISKPGNHSKVWNEVLQKKIARLTKEKADIESRIARLEPWYARLSAMGTANPRLVDKDHPKTAKDVLDLMIATLRYQHISATRELGANHPRTLSVAAAIDLAYAYRSGMVFIRPASAFLRNSYPATVLQNDSSTAWRNLLADHANRSLGNIFVQKPLDDDQKIQNVIDKQFWQNVNQIRVAGGAGSSNYAIVKDDIGNWYVKGYSSKVEEIQKGLKGIATFAAGDRLNAQIFRRSYPYPQTAIDPASPSSGAARTTLQKQVDKVTSRNVDEARSTYVKSRFQARKLNDELLAKAEKTDGILASEVSVLKSIFTYDTAKFGDKNAKAEEESKSDAELSADKLKSEQFLLLDRIRMYVSDAIKSLVSAEGPAGAAGKIDAGRVKTIKQNTQEAARDLILESKKEREASLGNYEKMLLFIGDSAAIGPTPTSP